MIVEMSNREKIALAGLLHDIGKMLNRSTNFMNKNDIIKREHPYLSKWFVEYLERNFLIEKNRELEEMVLRHHESQFVPEELWPSKIEDRRLRRMATIISVADNYSSAERDEDNTTKRNFKTVPLDCLFSTVSLDKKIENSDKNRYHIAPFSYNNIFPSSFEENGDEELERHINNFLEEVRNIKAESFDTLYTALRELIKKYCWCIPSDTQKNFCDISLYDHLTTTSAIALSIYDYLDEKEEDFSKGTFVNIKNSKKEDYFLLIGGDISGIQSYIFGIKSTEGASKRLRFRSFFIKLLTDIISYKLIKELDLKISNIIIASSGKFFILAPNNQYIKSKLEKVVKEINNFLYREYLGDIFFNCSNIELSGEDLGLKFSKKYSEINDLLNENKFFKFADEVFENQLFEQKVFNKNIDENSEIQQCKICGKRLTIKNENCDYCNRDFELGEKIVKTKKIGFYLSDNKIEEDLEIFGVKCKFYNNEVIEDTPFLVVSYEDTSFDNNYPEIRDYYGGLTSKDSSGNTMTFEDIAKLSASKNLGLLKGDVDNLGLIMSYGLKNDEIDEEGNLLKDITSISRIATMSRMLNSFFSYWIKERLKEENIYYIVYAGGDDFMILAPWNKLIDKANEIRKEFSNFTGENENITLTCAITLLKAKDPIYYGAKLVQEEEEFGKISGKNGIVLFDRYIPWENFYEVERLIDFLDKNMKENVFSQAFIYRLLKYTSMAEEYYISKNGKYLKYMSDFTYDVSRNIIDKKILPSNSEEIKILSSYFGIESIVSERKKEFLARYMRVVLNYVVRKNRGGNIDVQQ